MCIKELKAREKELKATIETVDKETAIPFKDELAKVQEQISNEINNPIMGKINGILGG